MNSTLLVITVVTEDDFLSWFEVVSQSKLRESLHFSVSLDKQ